MLRLNIDRGAGVAQTFRSARFLVVLVLTIAVVVFALDHAGTALVVSRPLTAPDAIVSLASHEWERLPATARLASRFVSSRVLLTTPRSVSAYNCHDCAGRVKRLVLAGVPAERIEALPDPVNNTYDEARAALAYSHRHAVHRLLVVTSPYHTRRALLTFRQVFSETSVEIGVQPALPDSPADPKRWWRHKYDRWYVAYEWAALLKYWVVGLF